tara:strand:+ start:348 stop:1019 length:672 start_codon:yes stop_codon:yes gene_type:complete
VVRDFDKYPYPSLERDETTGKRLYKTPEGDLVPSVTTILSNTKDNSGLKVWENRVGKEEAKRIRNEAAAVGTSMHLTLECYVEEKKREYDYSPVHSQANQMADIIIKEGLQHVSEVWGSEVQLYYKDKYAGTTDLVGMYKGVPHIIDFKQTNKPKKDEWIEDYYLQLCAYTHAHNYMMDTEIQNGVVLMCSRDLQFQSFEMNEIQFQKYSYMWFNRVDTFNKL